MRHYQPRWGNESAIFALLNRGKESMTIDLKSAEGREHLRPLVQVADVIIEGFRPGVMERLGLGYGEVASVNPKVVYCSVTAYGQTGNKRDVAAHDLNLLAESGLLALSAARPTEWAMPSIPLADIAGGAYPAMINILLGILERLRTGRGRHIDIALADNLFTLGYWALAHGWANGDWPAEQAYLENGASPRYRLYVTRDGKAIAAAPLEEKFWQNFCDVVGLAPELRDDRRDPHATAEEVRRLIALDDAAVWSQRFATRDCCCSVVGDLKSAVSQAHFRERGVFRHLVENTDGATIPALPLPLDPGFRSACVPRRTAPEYEER